MKNFQDFVELWWPHGEGDQVLYNVSVSLARKNGKEVSLFETKIGFRTVELVQEPVDASNLDKGTKIKFPLETQNCLPRQPESKNLFSRFLPFAPRKSYAKLSYRSLVCWAHGKKRWFLVIFCLFWVLRVKQNLRLGKIFDRVRLIWLLVYLEPDICITPLCIFKRGFVNLRFR